MDHAILLLGKLKLYGVYCLSLTGSSKTLDEFKRIISRQILLNIFYLIIVLTVVFVILNIVIKIKGDQIHEP